MKIWPVVVVSLFTPLALAGAELKVLCWNIWRGGIEKEDTKQPEQVARFIKNQEPDLVAMQETYGSGPWLQEKLGYELKLRGAHLSIFSRHPIVKDLSVGGEFHCIGALVDVPEFGKVAFYSIWLPFKGEIWEPGTREKASDEEMLAVCEPSRATLAALMPLIEKKLRDEGLADVPLIVAGDFNSMSHLDYTETAKDQFGGRVIEWPTSKIMTAAGFIDTYRAVNPIVDRGKDATWTPEFPEQQQDRIDFIYQKGPQLSPKSSTVVREFHPFFPSDHAALVTIFRKQKDDERP